MFHGHQNTSGLHCHNEKIPIFYKSVDINRSPYNIWHCYYQLSLYRGICHFSTLNRSREFSDTHDLQMSLLKWSTQDLKAKVLLREYMVKSHFLHYKETLQAITTEVLVEATNKIHHSKFPSNVLQQCRATCSWGNNYVWRYSESDWWWDYPGCVPSCRWSSYFHGKIPQG